MCIYIPYYNKHIYIYTYIYIRIYIYTCIYIYNHGGLCISHIIHIYIYLGTGPGYICTPTHKVPCTDPVLVDLRDLLRSSTAMESKEVQPATSTAVSTAVKMVKKWGWRCDICDTPLVMTFHSLRTWSHGPVEIVDLPIILTLMCDFPIRYVNLPEGIFCDDNQMPQLPWSPSPSLRPVLLWSMGGLKILASLTPAH